MSGEKKNLNKKFKKKNFSLKFLKYSYPRDRNNFLTMSRFEW